MIMAIKVGVRLWTVCAMLLCLALDVRADNLEYRYEVGVMAGGSSYYGDANYSSLLKNMNRCAGWRIRKYASGGLPRGTEVRVHSGVNKI